MRVGLGGRRRDVRFALAALLLWPFGCGRLSFERPGLGGGDGGVEVDAASEGADGGVTIGGDDAGAATSMGRSPAWIAISGGSFDMGSTLRAQEQPVHRVTVPAFELSRTEVTVRQYMRCVADGVCAEPADWSSSCYWSSAGFEEHPVNCVDWNSAVAFCRWAGGRLPSEAEWEYAASSAGSSTYPWGDDAPTCDTVNMRGCAGAPSTVCSTPAGHSASGVCDLSGNVWEWVEDSWHASYDGAPTDGSAWLGGGLHPPRGGSYQSDANGVRAAFRGIYFGPNYQNVFIGFRCARDVP